MREEEEGTSKVLYAEVGTTFLEKSAFFDVNSSPNGIPVKLGKVNGIIYLGPSINFSNLVP